MKHLFSYSVYQPLTRIPGEGDAMSRLNAFGCDGLELLTSFQTIPEEYLSVSPSVHLPYAIDWYTGWTEKIPKGEVDKEDFKYITFGRNRDEMISNIRSAIDHASRIDPAYGVLHAGNTDLNEVMHRNYVGDDRKILTAFIEMINRVVSGYKGGEPPFKLAFENLWWQGLKLTDAWEFRLLDEKLEFDNWGFCLDTGHMMNTLPDAYEEAYCIDSLLKIFDKYPQDMIDRIGTVHFHVSTSAEYRSTFKERDRQEGETLNETISKTYPHATMIDQHRPFSDPRCVMLVDALSPDFVTHEMVGSGERDPVKDFAKQRSHFF
jgi:Sugar phosphate isomerases/epimerases